MKVDLSFSFNVFLREHSRLIISMITILKLEKKKKPVHIGMKDAKQMKSLCMNVYFCTFIFAHIKLFEFVAIIICRMIVKIYVTILLLMSQLSCLNFSIKCIFLLFTISFKNDYWAKWYVQFTFWYTIQNHPTETITIHTLTNIGRISEYLNVLIFLKKHKCIS